MGVLPVAPGLRRGGPHRRVGMVQPPTVGGGEVTVAVGGGHRIAEPLPLAGKHPAHVAGDPVDLAAGPRGGGPPAPGGGPGPGGGGGGQAPGGPPPTPPPPPPRPPPGPPRPARRRRTGGGG